MGRAEHLSSAYTWLQPWEFISSVAGFVGLTLPLCCGDSPLHLSSSDNPLLSGSVSQLTSFSSICRGLELLVPHCAGRTRILCVRFAHLLFAATKVATPQWTQH